MTLGVVALVAVVAVAVITVTPSLGKGSIFLPLTVTSRPTVNTPVSPFNMVPVATVSNSYFKFLQDPSGAGQPIPFKVSGQPITFFDVEFTRGINNAASQLIDQSNRVVTSATPPQCVSYGNLPSTHFSCQLSSLIGGAGGNVPAGKYKVRVFYGMSQYSDMTPAQITAQVHTDSPLVSYGL